MTVQKERPGGSGPAPADVRVRVPRRPMHWGSKVRWTRHAVQAVLVAVVGWQAVGHVRSGSESAEAWCPLGGFEGVWTVLTTGRTVAHVHTSSLVLAATVLVLALVGRGFFCGWLCPLGTLQEMVHAAGRAFTDRVPPLRRLRRRLERGAGAGRWRQTDRVLRWGRWLVLAWAIIGAAVTGTMVFRVADPWIALLSVAEFEVSLAFVVLVITFGLALVIERPFCRYACPLGAVQSLAGKLSPIAVERDASACLACDLCNQACPVAIPVNTRTRVTDASCTGCLECVGACPSKNALTVTLAMPTFRGRRATTTEVIIPAGRQPVPTHTRLHTRRVPVAMYVAALLLIPGLVVAGFMSAGLWATTGKTTTTAAGTPEAEGRTGPGTPADPADVKGSMTVQQVIDAFPKITAAQITAQFNAPADTPTSTQLKTLVEDSNGMDLPALRIWIQQHAAG